MIIEQEFTVDAPREQVAALLTDIDRVSRCVPGVEGVTAVGEDTYEAVLKAKLGPISAAFNGSLHLDTSAAPQRLSASGQGRDQRSGSDAKVEFSADLEERDGATHVRTRADVTIRGRLGQFGTGVINSTARELVAEFARCVNATLTAAPGAPGPEPAAPPSVGRMAARGVGAWLLGLLRSLWSTLRRLARAAAERIRSRR